MADLKIAVIGCGNPNRGDDGVGLAVLARLRERALAASVELYDAGTDGMAVMYRARGATHLVIVDARVPQSQPGAIFEVPGEVLAAPAEASFTLHGFRWDHALYAGRQIYADDFPNAVKVFLIEAESLALGVGLSAPVQAVVEQVADRIVVLTDEFARQYECAHSS